MLQERFFPFCANLISIFEILDGVEFTQKCLNTTTIKRLATLWQVETCIPVQPSENSQAQRISADITKCRLPQDRSQQPLVIFRRRKIIVLDELSNVAGSEFGHNDLALNKVAKLAIVADRSRR